MAYYFYYLFKEISPSLLCYSVFTTLQTYPFVEDYEVAENNAVLNIVQIRGTFGGHLVFLYQLDRYRVDFDFPFFCF